MRKGGNFGRPVVKSTKFGTRQQQSTTIDNFGRSGNGAALVSPLSHSLTGAPNIKRGGAFVSCGVARCLKGSLARSLQLTHPALYSKKPASQPDTHGEGERDRETDDFN